VRNENQDFPVGTIRSLEQERVVQIAARMQRPEDFGRIIVARKNGATHLCGQVARVVDGAQEQKTWRSTTAAHLAAQRCRKSQDENTIGVVNGLQKHWLTCSAVATRRATGEITDGSRQIRVASPTCAAP
jgi:HAE1 family hydrophobic/amphiphilic exporter-1